MILVDCKQQLKKKKLIGGVKGSGRQEVSQSQLHDVSLTI